MSERRPVVVARDLAVGWGSTTVVEHVTFTIERGEVFGILGRSGSGKSTLMRVLIGLAQPLAGELELLAPPPQLGPHAPSFGVMFQQGALFGSLTVAENIALPLETWTDLPRDAIRAIAVAKLSLVGLADAADLRPAALSGGMRKRAAIARALALEPALVFLDEPSSGLDPITSDEINGLIAMLARILGLTIVVVTHERSSIRRVVDRCVLLDRISRSVTASGAPRELADHANPEVRAFFAPEPGVY